MASADVTRRELTLSTRDTTTGWPSKSYAESTIKGSFDPATARTVALSVGMPLGGIPYMSSAFYTGNLVVRGDRIEHAVLGEYELVNVVPITWLDQFVMYACHAEKVLAPADRAATSGTWHTDSEAIKTDPRNRIKTWIDTYISYAVCDYEVVFAGGDYYFEREFTLLGNELVCAVDIEQSTPEYTADLGDGRKPYKFNETCTITNTAIDTATLTATNILESFEQAIRDVATDYPKPIGNIYGIRSTKPDRVNIGGAWLWQNTITIEYTRANDDFSSSYPTITWGAGSPPYSGTFTIPNVINVRKKGTIKDFWPDVPSYSGSEAQGMGSGPFEVTLICDLEFGNWKRTLDKIDGQVFFDLWHNEGIDQDYHILALSAHGPVITVRVVDEPQIENTEAGSRLTVTFREQRNDSASDQTLAQRLVLT